MPKQGYSQTEELNPETTARARAKEIRVSHKHAREICKTIKGMKLQTAKNYLQDVLERKRPIPFTRYNKKVAHHKGTTNTYAAKYPQKATKQILKLLQNAQANAEAKNLDIDQLKITHTAAYPGMKIKRYTPRAHGRASPKTETTTNIEITLTQTQQGETTT